MQTLANQGNYFNSQRIVCIKYNLLKGIHITLFYVLKLIHFSYPTLLLIDMRFNLVASCVRIDIDIISRL